MRNSRRRQIFVDHQVQGTLMLRVVSYWFFCLLTVSLTLMVWDFATGPPRQAYEHFSDLWGRFGPVLAASLLLLPLVLIDCIRLSNRFVGPIYRMRRAIRRLADGQNASMLAFRETDFWADMSDDFNRLAARLRRQSALEAARAEAEAGELVGSYYDD